MGWFPSRVREPICERPSAPRGLTEVEAQHLAREVSCPYCLGDLYDGPQGGLSTNMWCKTEGCRSRFNLAVVGAGPGTAFGEFTGDAPCRA